MYPATYPYTYGITTSDAETAERVKCRNNIRNAADYELPVERTRHKPADTSGKNG